VKFKGRKQLVLGAAALALAVPVAACGSDNSDKGDSGSSSSSGSKSKGSVAVLLPDSKSSTRWETVDRPFLKKAFDAAGVKSTITNAEADKSAQQQQAEQAITNGAKVLLLVNLDSGSGAAIEGTVGLAAYAAAKSAVRGLSLSAANEWGSDQVRVNVVCPVAMAPSVPLFFKNRPGDYEASLAKIPLGRYGDPETDIGGAVAFLVSDDAQYITGQTIMIDGGQVHL
jgi:NAD(P)-dependent dehydrogenase (short-subunit alcohol dehydrogenase family)